MKTQKKQVAENLMTDFDSELRNILVKELLKARRMQFLNMIQSGMNNRLKAA